MLLQADTGAGYEKTHRVCSELGRAAKEDQRGARRAQRRLGGVETALTIYYEYNGSSGGLAPAPRCNRQHLRTNRSVGQRREAGCLPETGTFSLATDRPPDGLGPRTFPPMYGCPHCSTAPVAAPRPIEETSRVEVRGVATRAPSALLGPPPS